MVLSQKERDLLKDLKDQEQLCIDKYNKHASCAKDAQLKTLFTDLATAEESHHQMICDMEKGNVPTMPSSSKGMPTFSATYQLADTPDKQNDSYLCSDVLAGEKHVSHLYDTCIFEFTDENARKLLSDIQTQEQNHGKMIYDYMSANSMYS